MPNWCNNTLIVEDISDELKEYLQDGFSFNKIKPCEETCESHVESWGTKWDLDENEQKLVAESLINDEVAYFDTAWSPPLAAILELSRLFPDNKFTLLYVETGMCFCGETDFKAGEEYENIYINGSGEEYDDFLIEKMGMEDEVNTRD
jgi:hypothetical protein